MKNSIQVIAIALFSFSNVVSASDINQEETPRNAQIRTVSYANSNLLQSEIEVLKNNNYNTVEIIESDNKITENQGDLKTNLFINYANEELINEELKGLKSPKCKIYEIEIDLKITESNIENSENIQFINYANSNLLPLELDNLKASKLSITEKIAIDYKITEMKISKFNNDFKINKNRNIAINKKIKY